MPPHLFSIPLGLAGLATAWHAATAKLSTPSAVAYSIYILAAAVLAILAAMYVAQGPRRIMTDVRDPVQAPFLAIPAITAMMLAAALASQSFTAGRVLLVIFLAATIACGGWLAGQLIAGDIDQQSVHPGYYLPTVAGGLVGAITLAQVHLHALAQASFGLGIASWLLLGSVVLNRLVTARRLPPPLQPTMAIELAPAALAGVAWFALAGPGTGLIVYAIAGYVVLMAVVQIRLIPVYLSLRFTPGFWAFTFSYAIAATYALEWITRTNPTGAMGYAIAAIAAITILIAVIAARTLIAAARGQLLPEPAIGAPSPRPPVDQPRLR